MIPEACPRCGCTRAETHARASGPATVVYDLDARSVDYSTMHESLTYRGGTILYCQNCGRRFGRVEDAGDFNEGGKGLF